MGNSPPIDASSDAIDDDPSAARLQRSRRMRALGGHRRVDVMLSPAANEALQGIVQRRGCTVKEAIELALILQAKGLKKR